MNCNTLLRITTAFLCALVTCVAHGGDNRYAECDTSTPLGRIALGLELPRVKIGGKSAITVPGDYLEALIIARSDLEHKEAQEVNAARKRVQEGKGVMDAYVETNWRFLSDPKNYYFYIVKEGPYYRVWASPKPHRCVYIKGGGAHYKVDVGKKLILEREYTM